MGGLLDRAEITERGLGLGDQGGERCGLGDREIGEHLAVDGNLGLAEAVDKSTGGQAVAMSVREKS